MRRHQGDLMRDLTATRVMMDTRPGTGFLISAPLIMHALAAGLARRCGQRGVAEIERRALDDRAALIDDKAETAVFREEGQPMSTGIVVDPAFRQRRDLAGSQLVLQQRRSDAETFGDDIGIDLERAVGECDRRHDALAG